MYESDVDCVLGEKVVRHEGVGREPVGLGVVEDWLADSVEKEADPYPAGKQHHEPSDVVE